MATTDSKHDLPVAENILEREFSVDEPNKVWASDITYIPTDEGWLYLAGVLDLCSRTAVGWSMSESLERTLVMDALRMAYRRRRPGKGLIHHSDRGSQYASEDYRNLLKDYGMQMSMSRKGELLGQRPDGELLWDTEEGACASPEVSDPGRGQERYLRVHRGLLQPRAPAFQPGVSVPG